MADVFVGRANGKLGSRAALLWLSPGQSATARAVATLKALLPLRRQAFERRLALALREAAAHGGGFYLKGFAARRALGSSLVIEIDPLGLSKRLNHRSPGKQKRDYIQDRFVGAGNWAPMLRPLAASSTHRDVQEIIRVGLDYRDTEGYRLAMARSRGPHPVKRNFVALKSPQLVENYFRQITELCLSIREHGVGRREEYRSAAKVFRNPVVRLPWVEFMESDIGLAIGPQGELYHFATGKHRIAAAQTFALKSVPAEVRVVHQAWLKRQIETTGLAPAEALLSGIGSLGVGGHDAQD